jgi:hypothetical protein
MHVVFWISWISLAVSFASALIVAADEFRHPQKMWIMNVVWPVTALYFSMVAVWAYFRIGRRQSHGSSHEKSGAPEGQCGGAPNTRQGAAATWSQIAVSTSHCGAGCTLGDIIAEFSLAALALTLWGRTLYAAFAGDLLLAWLLGILFQYFSIKPVRNLSADKALVAAIKADTFSILSFEVGLFGWMSFSYFVLFPHPHLTPFRPGYWFMMQIGMVLGYFTAYPMNRWLIHARWKEAMG